MFFHKDFEIRDIKREGASGKNLIHQKDDGTPFVFFSDTFGHVPPEMTSLNHGEKASCLLTIKTPQVDGKYEIRFDISSRQGSMPCNPVFIHVMTILGPISSDSQEVLPNIL